MSRRKFVSGRHKARKGSRVTPKSIRYIVVTDCPGCSLCDALAASAAGVFDVWEDDPSQAESRPVGSGRLSFDQTRDGSTGDLRWPA